MQKTSILGVVAWGLGLTLLAYVAFLIHELLSVGSQKAMGVGILPKILYNPWFWATAALLFALVFVWRSR
jgi:hypothetical protein